MGQWPPPSTPGQLGDRCCELIIRPPALPGQAGVPITVRAQTGWARLFLGAAAQSPRGLGGQGQARTMLGILLLYRGSPSHTQGRGRRSEKPAPWAGWAPTRSVPTAPHFSC